MNQRPSCGRSTALIARPPGGTALQRAWTLPLALAALAGILRWLTRARLFYNWDSVQYALGSRHFDLLLHQPHPPGSYDYVLLSRGLNFLTGDPHTSLLMMSAVSGGLAVIIAYLLAREWGGEGAGRWAALTVAVAPLFWFYGSVGLPYSVEGLLAPLVALYAWRLWRGSHTCADALGLAASCGLAGGFRPTALPFLFPIWALGIATLARRHPARAAASLGLLAALTVGWLIPCLASAGGLRSYLALNASMSHLLGDTAVWTHGWPALREAATTHLLTFQASVLPGVGLLLLGLLLRRLAASSASPKPFRTPALTHHLSASDRAHASSAGPATSSQPLFPRAAILFVALWMLPAFLFYLLAHFNSPGYSLTYMTGLVALLAVGQARIFGEMRRAATVFAQAALVALLATAFWHGLPGIHPARWGQRTLAKTEIDHHDRYWFAFRDYLRARFPSREVLILVGPSSTDGLRVVQALLPERAARIYQCIGTDPSQLPPEIKRLPWLRFLSPEEVRASQVPVLGVARTQADRAYHATVLGLAPARLRWVELGGGFQAVVISPGRGAQRLPSAGNRTAPA
ncbi:MAG: glycosyltransferase family 39 protein [Armatimonadetes bacterium]|nr:glycosyltransferase family 39 protein [Armatimonadota bacterium]